MSNDTLLLAAAQPAGADSAPGLAAMGRFEGSAQAFWPCYLAAVGRAFGARRVVLLVRKPPAAWQAQAQWPIDAAPAPADVDSLMRLADQAMCGSAACLDAGSAPAAVAVQLATSPQGPSSEAVLVVFSTSDALRPWPTWQTLTELAAAVPLHFQWRLSQADPQAAQLGAGRMFDVLRLTQRLNQEPYFLQMALSLCNDLAVRFGCDRVCLGWVDRGYVRLSAVSHIEKFDRKASAAYDLELAMEEALAQEVAIRYPEPVVVRQVNRAHEHYARQHGVAQLMSVPLRLNDQVVGVLGLERRADHLSEAQAWELGLITQSCLHQLQQLRQQERWFGLRWWATLREWRPLLLTPVHTPWKLAGAAGLIGLLALVFVPWHYRIDAGVALRSKDLLFMPAPYDGFLRQVHVEVGDRVAKGAVLAELDTRDLLLEESMAEADVSRYSREAEKALAVRQLAEMQIALARQQQALVRVELIRHQLSHAQLKAPYAGIVVEGELKKNLGAPVRKGDLMLKLAQLDDNYVELEIDQVDVHEVQVGTRGEFALVGQPDQRFALVIDRMDPAATQREGRNVYLARGRVTSTPQAWWRPGMGGNAKLEVGVRRPIWVLTHRTLRFLRQVFWL
jgi:biotin carboxyl carrier protein